MSLISADSYWPRNSTKIRRPENFPVQGIQIGIQTKVDSDQSSEIFKLYLEVEVHPKLLISQRKFLVPENLL